MSISATKKIAKQKAYFSGSVKNYRRSMLMHLTPIKHFYRLSSKYIKGEVLDVGSGGLITYDIAKAKSVLLTDISEDLIRSPQKIVNDRLEFVNDDRAKTKVANVFKLPFKKSSFDTVLVLSVLHHLSLPKVASNYRNLDNALKESYRVVKPKGYLLIWESCLSILISRIYKFFYEVTYSFFIKFNKPLPYFFFSSGRIKFFEGKRF